jgi:hypothetical protein
MRPDEIVFKLEFIESVIHDILDNKNDSDDIDRAIEDINELKSLVNPNDES